MLFNQGYNFPMTNIYLAALNAAGVPLTDANGILAARLLESQIVSNNLTSSINCLYPYLCDAGTNAGRLTQASFNFMNPALYQISWVGSPTAASITGANSGITGNTTTMYGRTGLIPNTVYGVSPVSGLHVYLGDNGSGALFACDIAAANAIDTIQNTLSARGSSAGFSTGIGRIGDATALQSNFTYPANGNMYSVIRTDSATTVNYQNGTSTATNSVAFISNVAFELWVMAYNQAGISVPTTISPRQQRTTVMTNGTENVSTLYTVLNNFNTQLNRG